MDFSKAFNTVNHEILMSKLQHNGIRGVMLRWFKSYLSNSKETICLSQKLQLLYVKHKLGVPQGLMLGPVLFLLCINGMHRSSDQLCFVHFADERTVFASDSDINNVHASVNRQLVHTENGVVIVTKIF